MEPRVAVIGVGSTGYSPLSPERSYKELMYQAAVQAYDDAGVNPREDLDSFVTVAEDFAEGTSIFDEYVPDQLGAAQRSVHTITGDGLHGLATAVMLIKTGQCEIVAVEGHSKASNLLNKAEVVAYAQDPILNRPLQWNTHFVAGLDMSRYLHETGTDPQQCAAVVVKNRRNALRNTLAAFAADLTLGEASGGPDLAWPLSRRHTAEHADGAIVLVLAAEERARQLSEVPVWIQGVGWCNGAASLESREWGRAPEVEKAAQMAYAQAGIGDVSTSVDFAEVDDTYAFKELQHLEALQFCQEGEAGKLTQDGFTAAEGRLPVNASGGSLGMGDLQEGTGLARALEAVLQLRGEAGRRQLKGVTVGLAQSWRGVPSASAAVAVFGKDGAEHGNA